MAEECQAIDDLLPRSLTLQALCQTCGGPLRRVTDERPAMTIEDFLDEERFRWEHD